MNHRLPLRILLDIISGLVAVQNARIEHPVLQASQQGIQFLPHCLQSVGHRGFRDVDAEPFENLFLAFQRKVIHVFGN